ncbi:hypothetical protein VXS03_17965 [Photobacterium sp. S4TG1]|uniref:F4 family fimbrial subunit n=1 Tax=Photobacterium sp. S4TG1 TaxID=3114587 RepID=UPI002E199438|nr:hypothetical protein [Photobacterium sp. S4TG1]
MKKLVLSLVAVSTMLAAGAANAAAPAPFNGQLDFSGVITSTTPVWKWEIPTASQALAKGWTMKKDSGVITGTNTTYTIQKANIAFLQGYTTQSVASRNLGMAPTVKIAGVTITKGKQDITVQATGGRSGEKGSLQMVVSSAAGASFYDQNKPANVRDNSALGSVAWALIGKNAIEGTSVANRPEFSVESIDKLLNTQTHDPRDIYAAIATDLGNFSLTFPTASVPDSWTATVPAVVTYS